MVKGWTANPFFKRFFTISAKGKTRPHVSLMISFAKVIVRIRKTYGNCLAALVWHSGVLNGQLEKRLDSTSMCRAEPNESTRARRA
jgi:hypothetical protein